MTAEKFKSICEEKGIIWNDLVRIRVIRPKKFFGFFRQLTGITIEGAFNGSSACVEIMADDDNGVPIMHYIDYEDIIGYSGNSYTKIAFKNLAIYPTVLSKEDCIKAYNYLQTLKAK